MTYCTASVSQINLILQGLPFLINLKTQLEKDNTINQWKMKCFFHVSSQHQRWKDSDTIILQKQIKQQIVLCTMQISVMQLTRTGPRSRWKLKSYILTHFASQYQIYKTFFQSQKCIYFYGKKVQLSSCNWHIKAKEASSWHNLAFLQGRDLPPPQAFPV